MKKIFHLFFSLLLAIFLFSCSKKSTTATPTTTTPPVVTSWMTTANGGNTGYANATLRVGDTTGSAILGLNVSYIGTGNLAYVYVMKSIDNRALTPLLVSSCGSSTGLVFPGGSPNYTVAVPSNATNSFDISFLLPVRTTDTAVSDVYYVWLTTALGDFTKPTKNTVLGPA
ncbi:MAG TPA: hypothetical protein VK766_00565, partial [Cytophagaceae bacterium]|nr:hypothetical protein [Cytophagaceae bacterium]